MEPRTTEKPRRVAQAPKGRTVLALAVTSFILELATVISLLLDNCSLATILAILAALFGGATVMMARSEEKPDPFLHDPPPT